MILLDTHALIWLLIGDKKLGLKARKQIATGLSQALLVVSAISFWEIAMLQQKQRIELHQHATLWRSELLQFGLLELAVSGDIGIMAAELSDFHGDPADRIITATALAQGGTLLTADERLLNWPGNLKRFDARI